MQQVALMVLCVVLAVGMQSRFPKYLNLDNVEIVLANSIGDGIMALGMTIVMITGGIDISVAAVLQFTAILVGMLINAGVPIPAAIVVTLIAAAAIGWINVTLMRIFNVHPFIVTLATLLTLRGVNIVITDAGTVTGFPQEFSAIGRGYFAGVDHLRNSVVLFAVLAVIIGYALKNHRFFQEAYFIGGNRRSARMSGIKVERFLVFTYVLNAVLAGIAGIVICSQYMAASISFGQNAELRTITAVAVGGASLSGGTGTIVGTVLGWLFLAMVRNAFNMTGVNTYWQDVVIGVVLAIAVFFGEYLKRRRVTR
jgi:ribose/xylose/arabinose/galactoside ABC-type transport system permease subunit